MNNEQLQVFIEYTRRFDTMSESFPMFMRLNDPTAGIPPSSSGTTNVNDFKESFMLRYLNLCNEEWFLASQNLISVEVWKIWLYNIQQTLKGSRPFGEFWHGKGRIAFLGENNVETDFVNFVDNLVYRPPETKQSNIASNFTTRTEQTR
jgi:hypothetical protein